MTDALTQDIPTLEDMLVAHERIKPYIHRTPVLTSSFLNELTGAELFFKCENFQKAGAFKVRGASNAVFGLDEETAKAGVATHSSGNHALSLLLCGRPARHPCHVVMPRRRRRPRRTRCAAMAASSPNAIPSTSSREAVFAEVQNKTGANSCIPTTTTA